MAASKKSKGAGKLEEFLQHAAAEGEAAFPRAYRQDGAAFMAAWKLGLTTEQADALVAGMQAKRRELAAK